jgi:hypothetical protein
VGRHGGAPHTGQFRQNYKEVRSSFCVDMNYIVAGFAKPVKIPDKSPPRSVPEFTAKRDMEDAVARRAQFRSQWANDWRCGNYIAGISRAPPLLSTVEQHHFHAGALQRYKHM